MLFQSIHIAISGICYLYMKVIERSHYPRKLWERIKLSRNMTQAVRQIDDALLHWSEYVRHKCKARLIRIHQYLIRMRKMSLRERFLFDLISLCITKKSLNISLQYGLLLNRHKIHFRKKQIFYFMSGIGKIFRLD